MTYWPYRATLTVRVLEKGRVVPLRLCRHCVASTALWHINNFHSAARSRSRLDLICVLICNRHEAAARSHRASGAASRPTRQGRLRAHFHRASGTQLPGRQRGKSTDGIPGGRTLPGRCPGLSAGRRPMEMGPKKRLRPLVHFKIWLVPHIPWVKIVPLRKSAYVRP
eukprot:357845-Chlamydomonas_euryale.AAC.6